MSTGADRTSPGAPLGPDARAELLDALPLGVVAFDRERRIVYANTAAQRLVSPERLQQGVTVPPDSVLFDAVAALFARRPAGTASADVYVKGRVVQATTLPSSTLPSLLLLEDVGFRSRRERAEREFIANAAHELLTPVTGIVAAVHVLQSAVGDAPDIRARFVGHIAGAAERLARSARALLLLARAQSGEQPPRLELVPLRPLLEEATGHARGDTVTCAENVAVLADRDLLLQALRNLLENARRHSGGETAVDVQDDGDGAVVIQISDAGSGIDADQLERIGTRFFSGAGGESGGYGLGLAIAVQSAEAMGGTVEVASEPGVGTRASLRIASGTVLRS